MRISFIQGNYRNIWATCFDSQKKTLNSEITTARFTRSLHYFPTAVSGYALH